MCNKMLNVLRDVSVLQLASHILRASKTLIHTNTLGVLTAKIISLF